MPILDTRWACLAIAGVALLTAACSGSDGEPPPDGALSSSPTAPVATGTVEVPTTATVAPTSDATGVAPSDTQVAAQAALLEIMSGGGEDPFAIAPEDLPPALVTVLEALGVDLYLGAAVAVQDGVVTVASVFPGSPADLAGLAAGDDIVGLDDSPDGDSIPLTSAAELRTFVQSAAPGTTYALTIRRDGLSQPYDVDVRREADAVAPWRAEMLTALALGMLMGDGATTGSNSLLGEALEETPDGLLVTSVFPSSPADEAGLRAGDILISVNGNPLASIEDRDALVQSPPPSGSGIAIVVLRDGVELTLVAPLPTR